MSDSIFDALLNKTAKLYRPTDAATPNSFGERETSPGTVLQAALKVCIQPAVTDQKFEIELGGYKYWVELNAYMNVIDIRAHDILEVDSIKYIVVGIDDEGGQGHHLKVYIVKQ
jgi:hypothetical protein